MRLRITHDTHYRYSSPVETSLHMACLQPLDVPGQRLLSHTLQITPEPEQRHRHVDAFGNACTYWEMTQSHAQLRVLATSTVETSAPKEHQDASGWESVRDALRYHAGQTTDPQSRFVFGSHHAPALEEFRQFARPEFGSGRPLQEAAIALMRKIHRELRYESRSTDIHTPASQALQERRGVCQDFAHILIACLRSLGLPARYESGYLLTAPPPGQARLLGSDASHAWASVYLPALQDKVGAGWLHLDPTNDRCGWGCPGEDYVRLASGRDFGDVSPLRGVLQGGASHTLEVGVTVEPF